VARHFSRPVAWVTACLSLGLIGASGALLLLPSVSGLLGVIAERLPPTADPNDITASINSLAYTTGDLFGPVVAGLLSDVLPASKIVPCHEGPGACRSGYPVRGLRRKPPACIVCTTWGSLPPLCSRRADDPTPQWTLVVCAGAVLAVFVATLTIGEVPEPPAFGAPDVSSMGTGALNATKRRSDPLLGVAPA
jgi:hypothetical protein